MKVLIIGVNGFVGKYLIEAIKNRFDKSQLEIYGTYFGQKNSSINNVNYINLDITDKVKVLDIIKYIKPQYIFHLAALSSVSISWNNPQLTFETNVIGTIHVLNAIRELKYKPRTLIVGSSDEYGNVIETSISEEQVLNPQNPYAVSKVTQEMISNIYSNAYGMDIVMTRSFNHIGPGQEPVFVVSDWAKQITEIQKGIRDNKIFVGNIDVKRDFSDVRDIVNAYIDLIINGVSGEVYNVGSGNSIELRDILKLLITAANIEVEVVIDKKKLRPIENKEIKSDNTKLIDATGWKAKYKIENTLIDVLDYWRDNN
ncbi:GDP-mannose 4,6-dehydratase [Clostridium sp. DL1XJH146]